MYKLLPILLLASGTAQAKTLFSDYSVSYLNGNNYEVGDSDRQVMTLEHFAVTSWGDSFTFVDRLHSSNGDKETYAEFSPRLKLTSFENSPLKSVFIATTAEFGSFSSADNFGNSFTNYLYGIGSAWAVPGFDFVNLNLYKRNNDDSDNNYQTTISWGLPIGPLYFDGFMDYATSREGAKPSMNLTSQLKYDIAPHVGLDSKLYIGIEYAYWLNKFGIDGVDEKNMSLLVKYHF